MDEGTVLEWLVGPGDELHKGDIVAVVDTSKAAVEVESFSDGVVRELVVPVGTTVPVGTVLAHLEPLGTPLAVPAAAPAPVAAAEPAAAPAAAPAGAPHGEVHSPLVRKLAHELGWTWTR
ncbi:MAG: biotin/lipoyl-containing protein [Nocardioides sp.]